MFFMILDLRSGTTLVEQQSAIEYVITENIEAYISNLLLVEH